MSHIQKRKILPVQGLSFRQTTGIRRHTNKHNPILKALGGRSRAAGPIALHPPVAGTTTHAALPPGEDESWHSNRNKSPRPSWAQVSQDLGDEAGQLESLTPELLHDCTQRRQGIHSQVSGDLRSHTNGKHGYGLHQRVRATLIPGERRPAQDLLSR